MLSKLPLFRADSDPTAYVPRQAEQGHLGKNNREEDAGFLAPRVNSISLKVVNVTSKFDSIYVVLLIREHMWMLKPCMQTA